jgi:formamidopyrimidine-DNA glycosylase
MPELPEMQALAERLDVAIGGSVVAGVDPLGFTALKTVAPTPDELVGRKVTNVGRRGKYLVLNLDGGVRILVHLSQAGRLDIETPAKMTRPKGSVVRFRFDDGSAILVREHGSQRKAAWWVLGPPDDGPEPGDEAFAEFLMASDSNRRIHTVLRDQRTLAGLGRGYVDDVLNAVGLSPFTSLRNLSTEQRAALVAAIRSVLGDALDHERERTGGLSEPKLGLRFAVHNRVGQPCPRCGQPLLRVSYESYEIVYCKHCQTNGRALADRRLSRLLR